MLRLLTVSAIGFFLTFQASAQSCFPTNINGSVISLPCAQSCTDLHFQIPHIKGTSDYIVSSIPYAAFPYNNPTGTPLTTTYVDDKFSPSVPISFPFCFYDSVFNNCVIGSNGIVTFDISNAGGGNSWPLTTSGGSGSPVPIPYAGGVQNSTFSTYYPKSSIMGAYHDIDPSASPLPTRRIEYNVFGTAPCRKFVVSYLDVNMFSCTSLVCTEQIVMHESTGLIDVFLLNKPLCPSWNTGLAILGIQDWTQTKAVAAPGKNCTPWAESNTGYRFTPSGAGSRYLSSELYTLGGTLVLAADTATTTPGLLDINFPNICPPGGASQYVVKTIFTACDNPASQLITYDTITVNRSNGLNAAASTTNTLCGPPSGTITVTVPASPGVAPYTFSLDGAAPVTGPSPYTFTNVAQGPHTVLITDANGCTSTLNVIVNQTSNITAAISQTPTGCPGVNNGTITVTPAVGLTPFTYVLDGGAPVSGGNPYTFTGVASGTHTINITDASGCTSNPITITVGAGTSLTASNTTTPTTCAGVNNGSINVNATSGTAPWTYSLDGAAPVSGPNPHLFTGLANGTHTIRITDAAGCQSNLLSVFISAGSGVNATFTSTSTTCPASTNGTITVTATSGTAPYNFEIDGTGFNPGPNPSTFNNLASGNHIVSIRDNNGCTRTLNINITSGPALSAITNTTGTTCNGAANGTIMISPSGGTAPFTFTLDGGTPVSGSAPYTFLNVPSGSHTVVATDAGGCATSIINVSVPVGPSITASLSKTDVLCNGGNSGTITVGTPSPGVALFEYSLDGTTWQTPNTFTGLTAGTYTVYYREGAGCQGTGSITIGEPTALTAFASSVAAVCNAQPNGIITVTGSGATPPYEYSISGGVIWQPFNTFNVPAGSYTVTVRDGNGCTTTVPVTVTEPAALTASSVNTNASCNGGNDGTITVTAAGGNSSYTYSLDGTVYQPSNVFNVAPGNYTVYVKDNLGCTYQYNATVGLTNDLTFAPLRDTVLCEGSSVQLAHTSNAIQYAWTPRLGLSDTTIYNPVANPIVTTQYIVTATLGRCSANDTIIVNVHAAPIPNAGPDGFICYGQTYTMQASGGVTYAWSPTSYLNQSSSPTAVVTPPRTTTYTLSVLTDINGCPSLTTDAMTLDVTPPIQVSTSPFDTIAYQGDQFQITASSIANLYHWTPSTGLSDPNIPNPIVTTGAIGDEAIYQVVASTQAGCRGEGYVRIRVYRGPDIYVPTAFTPNGDGRNDLFLPVPVGIKAYKYFNVYNRWGQLVFTTTNMYTGWDGKLIGKEQNTGTFVWMIQGITKDNKTITKKGTVTLVR